MKNEESDKSEGTIEVEEFEGTRCQIIYPFSNPQSTLGESSGSQQLQGTAASNTKREDSNRSGDVGLPSVSCSASNQQGFPSKVDNVSLQPSPEKKTATVNRNLQRYSPHRKLAPLLKRDTSSIHGELNIASSQTSPNQKPVTVIQIPPPQNLMLPSTSSGIFHQQRTIGESITATHTSPQQGTTTLNQMARINFLELPLSSGIYLQEEILESVCKLSLQQKTAADNKTQFGILNLHSTISGTNQQITDDAATKQSSSHQKTATVSQNRPVYNLDLPSTSDGRYTQQGIRRSQSATSEIPLIRREYPNISQNPQSRNSASSDNVQNRDSSTFGSQKPATFGQSHFTQLQIPTYTGGPWRSTYPRGLPPVSNVCQPGNDLYPDRVANRSRRRCVLCNRYYSSVLHSCIACNRFHGNCNDYHCDLCFKTDTYPLHTNDNALRASVVATWPNLRIQRPDLPLDLRVPAVLQRAMDRERQRAVDCDISRDLSNPVIAEREFQRGNLCPECLQAIRERFYRNFRPLGDKWSRK